jgi:hypothetical protein
LTLRGPPSRCTVHHMILAVVKRVSQVSLKKPDCWVSKIN